MDGAGGHRKAVFAALAVAIGLVFAVATLPLLAARTAPGRDFGLYTEATNRWLAGGGFYLPRQLAGPYTVVGGEILYPPVAIFLFLPFLVLPAVLWWAIPLAVVAWRVYELRPAPWSWPILALCATFPTSLELAFNGNPSIWVAAFVALGTRWPALSALVFLKPSLFPFGLWGIRDRRWWAVVALLAVVSLAMLPMDLDWLRATLDAGGPHSGLRYSLAHVPFVALPLVAWMARSADDRAPRAGGLAPSRALLRCRT